MKRALTLLLTAALLAAATLGTSAGLSTALSAAGRVEAKKSPTDPQTKRDKVRRQRAATAAKLDALKADTDQVDRAIADLQSNTKSRQSELAAAKSGEEQAAKNVADAQAEVDAVMARMSTLSSAAKKAAIMAFTSGGESELFTSLLGGGSTDAPVQDLYYNLAVGDLQSALNDLEAARKTYEELANSEDLASLPEAERAREKLKKLPAAPEGSS